MRILTRLLLTALALLLAAYLIPEITVESFYVALSLALLLGLVNLIVRPVLVLLTLPVTILSLGLFYFVLNAFLFWAVAGLIQGFEVRGFLAALMGSIIVSVASTVGSKLFT